MKEEPKIVLDTNIYVSALLWENSEARKLLVKLKGSNTQIFASSAIIEEIKEVLTRDFEWDDVSVSTAIEIILDIVTLVNPRVTITLVNEDPDDNKIIECAVESKANSIITYDKHLLKYNHYCRINIILPSEYVVWSAES